MVNMQPLNGAMPIEMRLGDERRPNGTAFDDSTATEDMASSRRVLAELTAAGLFSLQFEIPYEMEFHITSPGAWAEFLERPKAGKVEADLNLLDRALMSADGRVIVHETGVAGAYRKGSP